MEREYIKRLYKVGNSYMIIIPSTYLIKWKFDKNNNLLKLKFDEKENKVIIEKI